MLRIDGNGEMTGFRLIGDAFHVIALLILVVKLFRAKSCAGISARSQILFAVVYTTRYLDLGQEISWYNFSTKIIYIICSYATVLFIIWEYRKSYEQDEDVFLTEFLIVPCFMVALYFNYSFTVLGILWSFSMYLEAVAILPQFYMIRRKKKMAKSLFYYLGALAAYRVFYILNWINQYYDIKFVITDALYVSFYAIAAADVFFKIVKITDGEDGTLLKSNLFLVTNNGPLEKRLILTNEQQGTEKNSIVIQPELGKF